MQQELGNTEPIEVLLRKERLHACHFYMSLYMSTLRIIKQTHLPKEETLGCQCNYRDEEKKKKQGEPTVFSFNIILYNKNSDPFPR